MKLMMLVLMTLVLGACAKPRSSLSQPKAVRDLEKSHDGGEGSGKGEEPGAGQDGKVLTAEVNDGLPVYEENGVLLYMQPKGISFAFDSDFPKAFRPACISAMKTANAALGREALTAVKEPGVFDREDDYSVISWGKSSEDFQVSEGMMHIAETYLRYAANGAIGAADIDFDIRKAEFTVSGEENKVDVETTCLHEIGHALGLKHSKDPNSVMYSGGGNLVKREFTARDITNLRAYDKGAVQTASSR